MQGKGYLYKCVVEDLVSRSRSAKVFASETCGPDAWPEYKSENRQSRHVCLTCVYNFFTCETAIVPI
jgi:hypothetical protein